MGIYRRSMAKKSELEHDHRQYLAFNARVKEAHSAGNYQAGVDLAVGSFVHVDGMMQFEAKYGKQSPFYSIDTIDFVLKYAPLLFDHESLDKLEALLKAQRRIEKNTAADLGEAIVTSRNQMWDAYRLWSLLEQVGKLTDKDLKSEPLLRSIATAWRKMGLLEHKTDGSVTTHVFVTRMEDKVRGKCPTCGATGSGAKAKLIEQITCPRCKQNVCFVLLSD